jgi:hypothetical protein
MPGQGSPCGRPRCCDVDWALAFSARVQAGAAGSRLPPVIKINAITVPHESGDQLAQPFAALAGAVDDADRSEGSSCSNPLTTGGRTRSSTAIALPERQGSPIAGRAAQRAVWSYIVGGGSDPQKKDDAMADDSTTIDLNRSELRAVAGYAVACARPALAIFERDRPDDRRPRAAIEAAQAFADGGERTKALRDSAWAAHRAAQEARDAGQVAASDAARAAGHAVGAAFLHPLPKATQVKHILGSAAHAARAFELSEGDDPAVGADHIAQARILAHPVVADVLRRYPVAPRGGGRVGELIRQLDASFR